jgi:hypothetical protein
MRIAPALDAQLVDWPVVSSGPRARKALRVWVEHHPGVLAGYFTPAELVAALPKMEVRLRNEVLQALLVEAGTCSLAERTFMQAFRGSCASVAMAIGTSKHSGLWEDDELVAEVMLQSWRAIRRHAGSRTMFTDSDGTRKPFSDPLKFLRFEVSRDVSTTARSRHRSREREQRCRETMSFREVTTGQRSSSDDLAELLLSAVRAQAIDVGDANLLWQYAVHDRSDAVTATSFMPGLSADAGRQRVQHRRKHIIGQLQLVALAEVA